MRSKLRINALAAVLAMIGMLAIKPNSVLADALVLCETNVGIPGKLLDGYDGMVYSPVAFDQIRTVGSHLEYWNENKDGLGILVFAGDTLGTSKIDDAAVTAGLAANEAIVTFIQGDGTVVHQCQMGIVAYDPALHDLAKLQVGDCSMTQLAGLPQLVAGHAQVWAFPQDFEGISAAPWRIADTSTLSASSFYLVAKAAGAVVVTAIRGQAGENRSISLCPFNAVSQKQVFDEHGPSDDVVCKDVNGAPMQLSVGQSVDFPIPYGRAHEISASSHSVVDVSRYDELHNTRVISGLAPGTSSLTMITVDGLQAKGCVVKVE